MKNTVIAFAAGIFLLSAIALIAIPSQHLPEPGPAAGITFVVHVEDSLNAQAIQFAEITLQNEQSEGMYYTDDSGNALIAGVEPGIYSMVIRARGYADLQKSIQVTSDPQQTIEVAMQALVEDTMVIEEQDVLIKANTKSASAEKIEYNYSTSETIGLGMVNTHVSNFEIPDDEASYNTESYNAINENDFKKSIDDPLSTFSIDVDNASYSNVRRFISMGQTPPKDAVRVEEMINYFDYDYPQPHGSDPFAINTELADCPWNPQSKLLLFGLQGKDIDYTQLNPSNLVFLIDVSGSMDDVNKLPLVKQSLNMLVDKLGENDRIAIVVYAGAAGLVLQSTPANQKQSIRDAINNLTAGGSTAGGEGIKLAYDIAQANFIPGGNNRVILCTDGDFNIGASSDAEMTRLIEDKRKSGVYITACGFGMGNYKDSKLKQIADNGNGNYFYIDDAKEAQKVFVTDMRGTLFTIAGDVKIQVEFNPARVKEYRLIGYESRLLNKEDFNNDAKDAGELGAGHRVTALYEVILNDGDVQPEGISNVPQGETLKYQTTQVNPDAYYTHEICTLRLRYKDPGGSTSKLLEKSVNDGSVPIESASDNMRLAAAVAEFGMLLRDSEYKGSASYASVIKLAQSALGSDVHGYRSDFIQMVNTYTGFAAKQ